MINILAQPTDDHIPVTDCLRWELQPDAADVFDTVGTFATAVVTFPATIATPTPNFVFWGYDFRITGILTPRFGGDYFSNTGIGTTTAGNFKSMLESNLFFRKAVTVTIAGAVVTVTWNKCGVQPSFTGTSMSYANLTGVGITIALTQGVQPIQKDGYKIVTQLLTQQADSTFEAVTSEVSINPIINCDDTVATTVDYMSIAKGLVFTPMPDLTEASTIAQGLNIVRAFRLRYGWIYRDDCQPISGSFYETDTVFVINAAYQQSDILGIRRFAIESVAGLPAGQPLPKFLTSQPANTKISKNSYCWLTLLCNTLDPTFTNIKFRFAVTQKNGTFSVHFFTIASLGLDKTWQPVTCNTSPAFVEDQFGISIDNIVFYSVTAAYYAGATIINNAVEDKTYSVVTSCFELMDLYFLTPFGGIGTILATKEAREADQDLKEIETGSTCVGSFEDRAKYGRTITTETTNSEVITFRSVQEDAEARDYFRDFKMSPQRWVQIQGTDGGYVPLKLSVSSGSVGIFAADSVVALQGTGSYAINSQQGNEPT